MINSVIIPCAGAGKRANLGYNKLKYDIGGMPLILKTISIFSREDISQIVLAVSSEDYDYFVELTKDLDLDIIISLGGTTRQESVYNALQVLNTNTDYVIIHDGARPFLTQETLSNAIDEAYIFNNAVVCCKNEDSLRCIQGEESYPVNRSSYVRVQTPQIFKYTDILRAHKCAHDEGKHFSDDASVFQEYISDIHIVYGPSSNIKITSKEDFSAFNASSNQFVGVGWDTHELVENRELILGGVKIPHSKGLQGHSDADVLTHAIMDALLSASHNKDIGCLFPNTDSSYEGISSLILLDKVGKMLKDQGYYIKNVAGVIMAQKPKLAPYIPLIQKTLANSLEIDETQITISATTTEKLGLQGREEAISANAYCLIYKK